MRSGDGATGFPGRGKREVGCQDDGGFAERLRGRTEAIVREEVW